MIAGEKLIKFFNYIILTENNDLTFKNWYFDMMSKFRPNEDHFDSKQIKVVYII